jgi:AraC-like DNA-binding protein
MKVARQAPFGKPAQSCRLARIHNWLDLAHEANYSVAGLAVRCKVSRRTLQKYFASVMREAPHRWLRRIRMQRALELLRDGATVKETTFLLRYSDHSHFSRDFKRFYGITPSRHADPHSPKECQISHLATELRIWPRSSDSNRPRKMIL